LKNLKANNRTAQIQNELRKYKLQLNEYTNKKTHYHKDSIKRNKEKTTISTIVNVAGKTIQAPE